jgi:acylphosphatase
VDREGVEYILIGAAAMGVHGVIRATEDLDIFLRADRENVERLRRALHVAYGADSNIDEISADDFLGDYPAVRYYRRGRFGPSITKMQPCCGRPST